MKYYSYLFLMLAQGLIAQSIQMEFPAFAGKTYDFIIFQGSSTETVIQDTIPDNGKFTLTVPKKYAPYTGMCRWLITGTKEGGGIDMAIPGHDFSVTCLSDKPDNTNIIYKGFDAVNELNNLNAAQQKIIDRFETMSRATQLYDKTHPLYASFQKEKEIQVKAYEQFQKDLKKNPSFNARFLPIVNLTQGIPNRLTDDYNERALLVNEFITKEMNYDDLYVSGHWQGIIQSWVLLQMNVINDKDKFVRDFKLINDRIKSPVQYTDFVSKLTYYLTQYGKDDYVDAIARTVLDSGKITEYLGSLQVYLKSMVGMPAPDILLLEHIGDVNDHNHRTNILESKNFAAAGYNKTLLIFYESGCGPCENLLEQLPGNYENIKKKGVRIIAISADTDEKIFKARAGGFPWKDTYCDYQGRSGANFQNYGVLGTPTIFLIDKSGKVEAKMAGLDEVLDKLK